MKSEELRFESVRSGTGRDVACNVFHPFLATMKLVLKCEPRSGTIMVEKKRPMYPVRADRSKKERMMGSDGRNRGSEE